MNTRNMHIPSNKVRDIERYCYMELAHNYEEGEIRQMVYMLFEAYLGWDKVQYLLHRGETINQSDLLKFHWAVEALKENKPIQQVIGYTDFCDCRIEVNGDVLIPRPETEEIVNTLLNAHRNPKRVLDICTGSGCIAIALTKGLKDADVEAIDVSERALKVAQRNVTSNQVEVKLHQIDVLSEDFQQWSGEVKYDLIVSNPPYVKESERVAMQANVLNYEPELALFVSDHNPLIFYRVIAEFAVNHLNSQGRLVFEINEALGKETCEMLQSMGFKTNLKQDFRDKDRMVEAYK